MVNQNISHIMIDFIGHDLALTIDLAGRTTARVNEFWLLGDVMRENQRNRQSAATWPRV